MTGAAATWQALNRTLASRSGSLADVDQLELLYASSESGERAAVSLRVTVGATSYTLAERLTEAELLYLQDLLLRAKEGGAATMMADMKSL